MKESDNLKKTESEVLGEVTPKEEAALVTELRLEAASFVPDCLEAIMAKTVNKTQESLVGTPEEKVLLASLKDEANAFVPDKLLDVMAAVGQNVDVSKEDEASIVAALEGDGQAFVPHDLSSVKKATGTYNPYLDQESLAVNEKFKNEGEKIVPDVKEKVYAETGAKKRFSLGGFFRKHWIALSSGVAVAAASIATVVVVTNLGTVTTASSTYVSVSITPASATSTTLSAYSSYNALSGSDTNSYTPTWSYIADANNLVAASRFAPANYSATLVGATISDSVSADKAAASLIGPSHQRGYLETKDNTLYNTIDITVYTAQRDYESKYASAFKDSIKSELTDPRYQIYANINFTVSDKSSELKGKNDTEAVQLIKIYGALNESDLTEQEIALYGKEVQVGLADLKSAPTTVLNAMENAIDAAEKAKLSRTGLNAIKEGIALSFNKYYLKSSATADLSEQEYANKLAELKAHVGGLPWGSGDPMLQDAIRKGLDQKSYYVVGHSIAGSDTDNSYWATFKDLRDYVMVTNTRSALSYASLLSEVAAKAQLATTSTGIFPDGTNNDRPDGGEHDPGNGPTSGGWGNGGGVFNQHDRGPGSF